MRFVVYCWRPTVINFGFIWSRVESSLIGNHLFIFTTRLKWIEDFFLYSAWTISVFSIQFFPGCLKSITRIPHSKENSKRMCHVLPKLSNTNLLHVCENDIQLMIGLSVLLIKLTRKSCILHYCVYYHQWSKLDPTQQGKHKDRQYLMWKQYNDISIFMYITPKQNRHSCAKTRRIQTNRGNTP